MQLNDWLLDDISKLMRDMSIYSVQVLYIKKKKEYESKCTEYINSYGMDKIEIEKQCELLNMEMITVALKLADMITE